MSYITQAEFSFALAPVAMLAIFDDNNDGALDSEAIDSIIARASSMVDAWIAPVYKGPFPITQTPIPALIRELTLQYSAVFALERHPDYAQSFNGYTRKERWDAADQMGQRLQAAVLRIPDYVAQPKPANVGGIVYDNSSRVMIDNADGTSNRGDF